MPATAAKKVGEAKALQTPAADFAQRVGDVAGAFFFADAPSAALCLSILGIMPPSLSSKHALEIANFHGSKLVYVFFFALQYFLQLRCEFSSSNLMPRGHSKSFKLNCNFRYSSASLSSGNFMLVINTVRVPTQTHLHPVFCQHLTPMRGMRDAIIFRSPNCSRPAACGAAKVARA
jgi:hypothetical protein